MAWNYYKVINVPPKANNAPKAQRNLKSDMGNVIVRTRESWLTMIWRYPFTKKYSNKYLPKLYLLDKYFQRPQNIVLFYVKQRSNKLRMRRGKKVKGWNVI